MSIEFRAVGPADEAKALDLWGRAFLPGRGYFDRYFRDDPWYREGDCLGAWDGERLVSAVHLCRRPVEWAGRTLWCGAIANVATDPEYRRRGLSRELLRLVIRRMEESEIDFSMLFTGQFGHYGALGWEQVHTPCATVELAEKLPEPALRVEEQAGEYGAAAELYWQVPPRPLLLHRPEQYYRGWVGWNWRHYGVRLLTHPEAGFAAVRVDGDALEVAEWHAMDGEAERELLLAAAREARAAGKSRLSLAALPYCGSLSLLAELGKPEVREGGHMMLRTVRLGPREYEEILSLYAAGDAVWWPSDAF